MCLCVSDTTFLQGPLYNPSNPWSLFPYEHQKSGQATRVTRRYRPRSIDHAGDTAVTREVYSLDTSLYNYIVGIGYNTLAI